MNKKLLLILTASTLFISAIVFMVLKSPGQDDFLARHGLDGMQIQDMVSHLEHKLDEPVNFSASITGSKLLMSDDLEQIELNLPQGLFYLSFAPYVNQTHPCATHNLVTCRGELKQKTFAVLVIDTQTSQVIFEGDITSQANGFAGIWLPVDQTYQITVTYGSLSATEEITTTATSDTCLTTLKLT